MMWYWILGAWLLGLLLTIRPIAGALWHHDHNGRKPDGADVFFIYAVSLLLSLLGWPIYWIHEGYVILRHRWTGSDKLQISEKVFLPKPISERYK